MSPLNCKFVCKYTQNKQDGLTYKRLHDLMNHAKTCISYLIDIISYLCSEKLIIRRAMVVNRIFMDFFILME